MNITIIPQTPEQFDRLMTYLEKAQAEREAALAALMRVLPELIDAMRFPVSRH